jgi:hypothetical protein
MLFDWIVLIFGFDDIEGLGNHTPKCPCHRWFSGSLFTVVSGLLNAISRQYSACSENAGLLYAL